MEELLRETACIGDLQSVERLLQCGANVNSQNDVNGWTALHWACKRGHVAVVRLLLHSGADIRLRSHEGEQPADVATPSTSALFPSLSPEQSTAGTAAQRTPSTPPPFIPSYLATPPFPYFNIDQRLARVESSCGTVGGGAEESGSVGRGAEESVSEGGGAEESGTDGGGAEVSGLVGGGAEVSRLVGAGAEESGSEGGGAEEDLAKEVRSGSDGDMKSGSRKMTVADADDVGAGKAGTNEAGAGKADTNEVGASKSGADESGTGEAALEQVLLEESCSLRQSTVPCDTAAEESSPICSVKKLEDVVTTIKDESASSQGSSSSSSVHPSDLLPLLVKVRVADSGENDFVEVEFAPPTYVALLRACCEELELQPSDVAKIRKLPNVLVRKDRDIERLKSGQEMEVVLKVSSNQPLLLVLVKKSGENDFVEVEFAPPTYEALLTACRKELELNIWNFNVDKIRKLPNVLVRNDRDVERLWSGQKMEVVSSRRKHAL